MGERDWKGLCATPTACARASPTFGEPNGVDAGVVTIIIGPPMPGAAGLPVKS